jgi:uncharacterized membrane protein
VITEKTEVSGSIEHDKDIDYLSFIPKTTDIYRFTSNSNIRLSIYDQSGNVVQGTYYNEVTLDVGKTYYVKVESKFNGHTGMYYTGDYKFQISIVRPDLVITDITPIEAKLKSTIALSATVKNVGNGGVIAGQSFRVKFTIPINGKNIDFYSSSCTLLGAGIPVTLTLDNEKQLEFSDKGTYPVTAVIDGTVSELKYENNSKKIDIKVGYPDLAISAIEITGDCLINTPAKTSVVVKNVGLGSTEAGVPFKVKLTIDGQDGAY